MPRTADPRARRPLSARDRRAGVFIGEGSEVAQYQLAAAVFPDKDPMVVSRFVARWRTANWLRVDRWRGMGINRLRLTSAGRRLLVAVGAAAESSLFAPPRLVAPQDLAHTLWINDVRVVLGERPRPPKKLAPAWALQRTFGTRLPAIPDLLAVWDVTARGAGAVLAIEIDRGTEALQGVFLPKLARLTTQVRDWAGRDAAGILVLTMPGKRRQALTAALPASQSVPIVVATLPTVEGPAGLDQLRRQLADPSTHPI